MTDTLTFEQRLQDAFERYVASAPTRVEPAAMASEAVRGGVTVRRGAVLSRSRWGGSRLRLGIAVLLVGALMVAAAFSAGRLVTSPAPVQSPTPPAVLEPTPSASSVPDLSDPAAWTTTMHVLEPFQPIGALLTTGRVLVVHATGAELWDPRTGRFARVGDPVLRHTFGLIATLRDGRVLVVGAGNSAATQVQADSAEVFAPGSLSFRQIPDAGLTVRGTCHCGPSLVGMVGSSMTRTATGAFIAGGYTTDPPSNTDIADVFDAATSTFSKVPIGCGSTRGTIGTLRDGRVLITCFRGGEPQDALLFDPGTGRFTATGAPTEPDAGLLIPLQDGRALLTGHVLRQGTSRPELYDPLRGVFAPISSALNPPYGARGVSLADGRVLFAGTSDPIAGTTDPTLMFDPATNAMSAGPELPLAAPFSMVALPDGRVLLLGGDGAWAVFDPR